MFRLLENKKNIGVAAANNMGIKLCPGSGLSKSFTFKQ